MISDKRKQHLMNEYDAWAASLDGCPSEFGELLCELDTTDEEEAFLAEYGASFL